MAMLRESPLQDRYQKYLKERAASEPEASVHLGMLCSSCSSLGIRKGVYNRWKKQDRPPTGIAVVALHPNLDTLFRAANQGCHHCTILSYSLKQREQEEQEVLRRKLKLFDELGHASESRRSEIQYQLYSPTAHLRSLPKPSDLYPFYDSQLALRVSHRSYGCSHFEIVVLASGGSDQKLDELVLLESTLSYRRKFINDITSDPNNIEGKARFSLWTGSQATFALARDWISTCKYHHKKCSVLNHKLFRYQLELSTFSHRKSQKLFV